MNKPIIEVRRIIDFINLIEYLAFVEGKKFELPYPDAPGKERSKWADDIWCAFTDEGSYFQEGNIVAYCVEDCMDYFDEKHYSLINEFNELFLKHFEINTDETVLFKFDW